MPQNTLVVLAAASIKNLYTISRMNLSREREREREREGGGGKRDNKE